MTIYHTEIQKKIVTADPLVCRTPNAASMAAVANVRVLSSVVAIVGVPTRSASTIGEGAINPPIHLTQLIVGDGSIGVSTNDVFVIRELFSTECILAGRIVFAILVKINTAFHLVDVVRNDTPEHRSVLRSGEESTAAGSSRGSDDS